jgi:hypothetical protein
MAALSEILNAIVKFRAYSCISNGGRVTVEQYDPLVIEASTPLFAIEPKRAKTLPYVSSCELWFCEDGIFPSNGFIGPMQLLI